MRFRYGDDSTITIIMPVLVIFPVSLLPVLFSVLFPAGPGAAGDKGVLGSILDCRAVESFNLAGDVLDDLGHLHYGLHLLAGFEREQVEELLQAGLGVLQVRVDRLPDVLREKILILNSLVILKTTHSMIHDMTIRSEEIMNND